MKEKLNFFLNHSKIYPNIAPDGVEYLDATEILKRSDTVFFNFGDGAVLFTGNKLDAYFLKGNAKKRIQSCIREMFNRGMSKIIAEVPAFNKKSRYMVRSLGFEKVSVQPKAWKKDGILYDILIYELENK